MMEPFVAVPQLDPAADRRAAWTLTIAAAALWLTAAAPVLLLAGNGMGTVLAVAVGVIATLWTVLAVVLWRKSVGKAPELLARREAGVLALGAPLLFRRGKPVGFDPAVPVVLTVTGIKQGASRTTKWHIAGSTTLLFMTQGLPTEQKVATVKEGLGRAGLVVVDPPA